MPLISKQYYNGLRLLPLQLPVHANVLDVMLSHDTTVGVVTADAAADDDDDEEDDARDSG